LKNKLVEGHAFATSFLNSETSVFSEFQSANSQLGDYKKSLVVSDGADNDGDLLAKR